MIMVRWRGWPTFPDMNALYVLLNLLPRILPCCIFSGEDGECVPLADLVGRIGQWANITLRLCQTERAGNDQGGHYSTAGSVWPEAVLSSVELTRAICGLPVLTNGKRLKTRCGPCGVALS